MEISTQLRKPLGVRVTAEQHRILTEAAKREHRSVSSFVLTSALAAATQTKRQRTPEEVQAALTRAQELMAPYRRPGVSLVDEFIADKRAEAARD